MKHHLGNEDEKGPNGLEQPIGIIGEGKVNLVDCVSGSQVVAEYAHFIIKCSVKKKTNDAPDVIIKIGAYPIEPQAGKYDGDESFVYTKSLPWANGLSEPLKEWLEKIRAEDPNDRILKLDLAPVIKRIEQIGY